MVSSVRESLTVQFDPGLLARARMRAARENRALTNLTKAAARRRVAEAEPVLRPVPSAAGQDA